MSKKFVMLLSLVLGSSLQGFASDKSDSMMETSPTGVDGLIMMEFLNEDLLFDAVKTGEQDRALVLIESGTNIDRFTQQPTGWNDLMVHALSTSSFDVALKLIEKGVNVQFVNSDGATYAHAMAYEGNLESLKFLKMQGLDLDSNGVFFEDKITCPGIKIERPVDLALVWHASNSQVYKYLYGHLSDKRQKQTKAKLNKLVQKLIR